MKKIVLTIALVISISFASSAQHDGFFTGGNDGSGARDISNSGTMPKLPTGGVGAENNDMPAPVGSGLLILTALGAGYAMRKRNY